MVRVMPGSIKYHLSLRYDSTWDWTQVSRAIGEHFNQYVNIYMYIYIYIYILVYERICFEVIYIYPRRVLLSADDVQYEKRMLEINNLKTNSPVHLFLSKYLFYLTFYKSYIYIYIRLVKDQGLFLWFNMLFLDFELVYIYIKVKLATFSRGWPDGSLFDSYYTKV